MSAPLRSLHRLKLFACCLALTLMVFWQSPGDTATDTKFDLVVSPWRFLGRALQLWDPLTSAGTLQNQAYGYAFPMGPFFGLLHSAQMQPWVTQRLWESALLIAAFLGVVRLTQVLGISGLWPRIAAGACYALSPRMLSELTSISSELMPVAVLPWVLVPLVRGSHAGSERRAGARSGIALLFAGGVNAGATLAILPAPALWLLTRSRGKRRAALARWWILATVLACLWWAIPLLLLGRYSPPFLNWIETSAVTTQPTSLFANLRGVDHWEAYLGPGIWPAGWILVSVSSAVVATALVAGFGLCGLGRRDVPERAFLWSLLLLGLILVGAGHAAGSASSPAAGTVRDLLDGPLAALRNIHKFDPLIRLPIAVGVGHLVSRAGMPERWHARFSTLRIDVPVRRYASLVLAVVAALAISPALSGQLVSKPRVTTEPGWWRQTGTWLAVHSDGNRAFVVPGSAAPAYLWGSTTDDALQPVATTPWTTRDAVPLTQAGYIRLLDAFESVLAQGQPSDVLAALLRRAGIGYVVLRNDLNTFASASTPTVLVRNTLTQSGGFHLAASFGPAVGGSAAPNNLIDGGLTVARPSVEIYALDQQPSRVSLTAASAAVSVNGSSDALVDLVAAGLAPDSSVLFNSDSTPLAAGAGDGRAPGLQLLTDGIPRQQASFANLLTRSNTLAADESMIGTRKAYDYLPDNAGTLSEYTYGGGLSSVSATSSGAAMYALAFRGADHGPWSALDGDPTTAWVSSSGTGAVGQSLSMRFSTPIDLSTVGVSFESGLGPLPTRLLVTTSAGASTQTVIPAAGVQQLAVPRGPTSVLSIGVAAVAGGGRGTAVGIQDLHIPGLHPTRSLAIAPATTPLDGMIFTVAAGRRAACLPAAGSVYCEQAFARAGQEDDQLARSFTLSTGGLYQPGLQVRFAPGAALNTLLDKGASVAVSASSTSSDDPRLRPEVVLDGDPATYWRARPGDPAPRLTVSLARARTVTGISLQLDSHAAAARPELVSIRAGSVSLQASVPTDGVITFPAPTRATSVSVTVLRSAVRSDTDSVSLHSTLLPAGISELGLLGTDLTPQAPTTRIRLSCAQGPTADVDGQQVRFSVDAAVSDVLAGRPVTASPCPAVAPVYLGTGPHTVSVAASGVLAPYSLSLMRPGSSLAARTGSPAPAQPVIRTWGATSRSVTVSSTSTSLLVVRENYNIGWRATVNGHTLAPVRVDGWQQAFVVPAGTAGTVAITFPAQTTFSAGLVAGLIAALLVAALGLLPARSRRGTDDHLAAPGARWSVAGWTIAVVGGAWLIAGLPALVVAVVAAGALSALRRWDPWLSAYLPLLAMLVTALVVTDAPHVLLFTTSNALKVQLLCVFALTVAALATVDVRHPPEK